ncbi:MAG TPA: hypothetical protein VEA99_13790 [Gemmatimonadaceae bacterium]|nr:hypothetical protein [Gemmatimonadaceae bacterium]
MANRDDQHMRDETDQNRSRRGDRRADELEEGIIEGAGHPTGGAGGGRGDVLQADMPANTDPQREQHTRKGQAQSPRELTHNEPEKKHVPGGRG